VLISIVVIFYNRKKFINRALGSIIGQTCADLDIVVVDDGSFESISNEVSHFHDPRVRYFRKENGGPASSRNLRIEQSAGEYIAFLDGDDVFLPTKIERMVQLLKEHDFPACIATCGVGVVTLGNMLISMIKPRAYSVSTIVFPEVEVSLYG